MRAEVRHQSSAEPDRAARATAFTEPSSPWENGRFETCDANLRDKLLDGERFYSLAEAKVLIESWRQYDNTKRPHSSVGYPRAVVKNGRKADHALE